MRYAIARYKSQRRDLEYRIYVTDTLALTLEATARLGGGSYKTTRFADIIKPKPIDARTGEEIVADIIQRAGLEVKQD